MEVKVSTTERLEFKKDAAWDRCGFCNELLKEDEIDSLVRIETIVPVVSNSSFGVGDIEDVKNTWVYYHQDCRNKMMSLTDIEAAIINRALKHTIRAAADQPVRRLARYIMRALHPKNKTDTIEPCERIEPCKICDHKQKDKDWCLIKKSTVTDKNACSEIEWNSVNQRV